MRVIGTLQKHPKVAVTVFMMNEKFVVKCEAGPMEQVYKFATGPDSSVNSLADIDAKMTPEFMSGVIERFNAMFLAMK